MPATETPPILPPKEAVDWFRRKGWVFTFDWQEIWAQENISAFTVAKIMSRDLLEDVRAAVDAAIANGESLGEFAKKLRPTLQAKGWWGKKEEVDPLTGETRVVQLGSPQRLRTIYRTNMTTAYQAGRWERIQRQKATFPFLRYLTVDDSRVRETHAHWHDVILPVDHPWWRTHYPPNDWGCRCTAIPMNQRMMDRRGLKVTEKPHFAGKRKYTNKRTGEVIEVEKGIGPGWDYNVGEAPKDGFTVRGLKSVQAAAIEDVPASLSDRDWQRVSEFFAAFGIQDAAAAARGKVFIDDEDWPLAISGSMLEWGKRPAKGDMTVVADAIIQPARIDWVWVRGRDSRVMLVRRYTGADGAVVDFGKDWWRWKLDESVAASNRYQPRHKKGTSRGGQFKATGKAEAAASIRASQPYEMAPFKSVVLGKVSDEAAAKAAKVGIDLKGKGVYLSHSEAGHIRNKHWFDTEIRTEGLRPSHLINANKIINEADFFVRADDAWRSGNPSVQAHKKSGKKTIVVVGEVTKYNFRIVTMYWKQ